MACTEDNRAALPECQVERSLHKASITAQCYRKQNTARRRRSPRLAPAHLHVRSILEQNGGTGGGALGGDLHQAVDGPCDARAFAANSEKIITNEVRWRYKVPVCSGGSASELVLNAGTNRRKGGGEERKRAAGEPRKRHGERRGEGGRERRGEGRDKEKTGAADERRSAATAGEQRGAGRGRKGRQGRREEGTR